MSTSLPSLTTRTVTVPVEFFDGLRRSTQQAHPAIPVDAVRDAGYAAGQALFDFSDIAGTLVGFWSPPYSKSISITGHHMHFISADRKHGGHVLDLSTDALFVELNDVNEVRLAIPETSAFLGADLTGDTTEALDIAEGHGRVAKP